MTYFISRLVFGALLNILLKFKIEGRENFPKKRPFIVASNHTSFLDPVVIAVACNTAPLTFMAKRELFDRPFLGRWLRGIGCIPIDKISGGAGALKKVVNKIKKSCAIGIFPEGTRSLDGTFKKAEPGIGLIALKTKAPIVPVYIKGALDALPKDSTRVKFGSEVIAKIGKPISINEDYSLGDRKDSYKLIGERVMQEIENLKNE